MDCGGGPIQADAYDSRQVRALALRLRQYASETTQPVCIRLFLRAAQEADAYAASLAYGELITRRPHVLAVK
jgi:hypothetical protein